MSERKTTLTVHINASKVKVYNTLLDKDSIPKWKVPDDMVCVVHEYNTQKNGTFRISLTYDNVNIVGKTTQNSDMYHGYFKQIIPNELIVEIDEFESDIVEMQGLMTITYRLSELNGGTDLSIMHDNLPIGISMYDNKIGWTMALDKLKRLVEEDN